MINFIAPKTIALPVEITIPGQTELGKLTLTFKYKTRSQLDAWLAAVADKLLDAAVLGGVIDGWDGVVLLATGDAGEAGDAVPYTRENLALFLDAYPASAGEIYRAYLLALTESRVKN